MELATNMIETKCQYLEGQAEVEDSDIDEEELYEDAAVKLRDSSEQRKGRHSKVAAAEAKTRRQDPRAQSLSSRQRATTEAAAISGST